MWRSGAVCGPHRIAAGLPQRRLLSGGVYGPPMTDNEGPRFAPRGRKLVFMQIADVIAARINDGTYPPEGRLPAELEFVAEFGASRESVRRAIQELRQRGMIETVSGKGSFVLPEDERQLGNDDGPASR